MNDEDYDDDLNDDLEAETISEHPLAKEQRIAEALENIRKSLRTEVNKQSKRLKELSASIFLLRDLIAQTKGKNYAGLNINRDLRFALNGVLGIRQRLKDDDTNVREANRTITSLRVRIKQLKNAVEAFIAKKQEELDKQPSLKKAVEKVDFNPRHERGEKFDEFRRKQFQFSAKLDEVQAAYKEQLEEDAKPIDDPAGILPEDVEESLDKLASLTELYEQEFLRKLPKKVTGSYEVLRLPLIIFTEKAIRQYDLDRSGVRYHDLQNQGYIFERQIVLAIPKYAPPRISPNDPEPPDPRIVALQDYYSKHDNQYLEPLIGSVREKKKAKDEKALPVERYTPRVINSIHTPGVSYVWLIERSTFYKLDSPKVLKAHLAFSQKANLDAHDDLSKLSREALLGELSDRYDPDNFLTKLNAFKKHPNHRFRLSKLPVMVEVQADTPMRWSANLPFTINKIGERQYVLDNQVMIVMRKADYNSPLYQSPDARFVMDAQQVSKPFREKIGKVLHQKYASRGKFIDPLNGMAITTQYADEFVYLWMLPESEYLQLGAPKFVRFGFPFSGSSFTGRSPEIEAKQRRFTKQIKKLEKALHREHPRLFKLAANFKKIVAEVEKDVRFRQDKITALEKENHRLLIQLASNSEQVAVHAAMWREIARFNKEDIDALQAELKKVKRKRRILNEIYLDLEAQVEFHRTTLRSEMLSQIRA